jgi:hypothetical protein
MALEVKHDNSLMLMFLNIYYMVVYTCKKCGELNYLTPHAFWNITREDVWPLAITAYLPKMVNAQVFN